MNKQWWLLVLVFGLSQSALAASFPRLDDLKAKSIFSDYNGDSVEESRSDYEYEPHLDQWFYSTYSYDTAQSKWIPNYTNKVTFDEALKRVTVEVSYSSDGVPEYCQVFELNQDLKPSRSFYINSSGVCDPAQAMTGVLYEYYSSGKLKKNSSFYATAVGVFDWTKPSSVNDYEYTATGKVLRSRNTYGTSTDWYQTAYTYDALDRLVLTDATSSYSPTSNTMTQYVYDENDDLSETTSITFENAVPKYFGTVQRFFYDPATSTKTTYSFNSPSDPQPYSKIIRTYDASGYALKDENEAWGSKNVTRYEY